MEFLRNIWNEEEGQGLVEYGLILALIVIVIIATLSPLGQKIAAIFTKVNNAVTS